MSEQKKPKAEKAVMPPLFHQIPEACQLLNIGRSMLYELIAARKLKSVTIGRRRLIAATEIDRFVSELTKAASK
jgi:excisionase family DNA binding protein